MEELPGQSPKIFTVTEAHHVLPQVQPLVEQLQGLRRSIVQTNRQLDELVDKVSRGNGYPIQSLRVQIKDATEHLLRLVQAFQSALKQLENFGCILKDLETGLVDFYYVRHGELILLCWKLGENRIQFWHSLEGGYQARQPLDE